MIEGVVRAYRKLARGVILFGADKAEAELGFKLTLPEKAPREYPDILPRYEEHLVRGVRERGGPAAEAQARREIEETKDVYLRIDGRR